MYWWRFTGLQPTELLNVSPVGGYGLWGNNTESLVVGIMFGECHAPYTLNTSLIDFEKEKVHCSRYKILFFSSLSSPTLQVVSSLSNPPSCFFPLQPSKLFRPSPTLQVVDPVPSPNLQVVDPVESPYSSFICSSLCHRTCSRPKYSWNAVH